MNRRWAILLFLFSLTASVMAQGRFYPSRPRSDAALYEGPVYGVKGGANIPRLYYTNPYLNNLPHDFMITPSAGLFLEIPFLRPCTLAPELNYQRKGGSFSYLFDDHFQETYSLQADHVSFRVPLYFYMPISDRVKPYFLFGPDMGFALRGNIALTHPDHHLPDHATEINLSNYNYIYLGALGGFGIRFNIPLALITLVVKADAAVNWGVLDSFSRHEHAGIALPDNVNAYYLQGKRYLRGLEVQLGLGFFINKPDACGNFQPY